MTGPQRTCIGCMTRDDKEHMLRIAASGDSLTLDEEDRMPGRGAYLHYRSRCITDFVHKRSKELRSLRRKLSLEERRKLAELIYARLDKSAALEIK
jgi:predicted RNA-binding protein YlxR (DUF448 family)